METNRCGISTANLARLNTLAGKEKASADSFHQRLMCAASRLRALAGKLPIRVPWDLDSLYPDSEIKSCAGCFKYIEKQGFLAEAVKSNSTANPLSGEEVEKIVAGLFKLKPALIAKMADILK